MQPTTDGDHKKLLTDVIKKQIVILGPDITLAKARNVKGLTIADDGTVTELTGDHQEITQQLIDQFMELSGLIVKKTMEPLLANYPNIVAQQMSSVTQQAQINPLPQAPQAAPVPPPPNVPTQSQPTQNENGI